MILTNNSTYPIGLDLTDLSIKAVQLNKRRDNMKIQSLGKVSLDEGVFIDGEIIDKEKVSKALKKLISNPQFGKFSTDEVVACLPEAKTFIKLIEVEKGPNDLANTIENEIEKHVPMSLKDIYYDWQIIEDLPQRQLILIGAAPKYLVDQYTQLLEEAHLSVVALEIEPLAICRSLLVEENNKYRGVYDKNYGIIDIGAKGTSMTLYSKNTILFTISMPISGEQITDKIATTLKISKEQAEKAKIVCGLDEKKADGIIKNILTNTINELIEKIKEAIEFYDHHFPSWGSIGKIYLVGGGANIDNLSSIIQAGLNIKTEIGNTLINIGDTQNNFDEILKRINKTNGKTKKNEDGNDNSNAITRSQNTNLTFATAIGLALRGLFIQDL